jgi:hypothetical protein
MSAGVLDRIPSPGRFLDQTDFLREERVQLTFEGSLLVVVILDLLDLILLVRNLALELGLLALNTRIVGTDPIGRAGRYRSFD